MTYLVFIALGLLAYFIVRIIYFYLLYAFVYIELHFKQLRI